MSGLRDHAKRTNSPPLQGRGRGWGLSAERIDAIQSHARQMRREPTAPEQRLWTKLCRSQLGGFKFRRQATIGSAIVDFLCPQKGLVLEVDGHTHTDPAADARRTARLEALGFHVLRVTNTDVMANVEGVLRLVLDTLQALPDRRKPHPNPSPEGERLKQNLLPPSPSGEGPGVGPISHAQSQLNSGQIEQPC